MMNFENRTIVEKKPERIAGQRYTEAVRILDIGGHNAEALALHIAFMLGKNEWNRPIWQKRELSDGKVIELEKFEDYLLFPPREGLKQPSLINIDANLKTLPDKKGMEALRMIREAIPDWDDRIENERMKQTVKEAPVMAESRRPTKEEQENKGDIGTVTRGSNSVDYLVSRLKRDAPEIAKQLERGEFKSVRAAAKAAGIVKDKSQIEIAKSAWKRMNYSERTEFLTFLDQQWNLTSTP